MQHPAESRSGACSSGAPSSPWSPLPPALRKGEAAVPFSYPFTLLSLIALFLCPASHELVKMGHMALLESGGGGWQVARFRHMVGFYFNGALIDI